MSNMHRAINYLFFSILGFGVCCMLTYVGINLIFFSNVVQNAFKTSYKLFIVLKAAIFLVQNMATSVLT
jgi:hypothetical protein